MILEICLNNQIPTYEHFTQGESTDGALAIELMRRCGVHLDEWQQHLMHTWLSHNRLGNWANPTCGISIPRQNGKTLALACLCVFVAVKYGMSVIFTAHLQKTATEAFQEMKNICECRAMKTRTKDIRCALGREQIEFTNGARIQFVARTRNGGRGLHGGLLCFDEAQELDYEQQASFIPALAASANPLTVYAGTPPDVGAYGDVFTDIREKAYEQASGIAWAEWSVSSIDEASNPGTWERCNPSFGLRIKQTTIAAEFAQMRLEKFARERLGWFEKRAKNKTVFERDDWLLCATDSPPKDGVLCYAVKFAPDGTTGSLSVCLKPTDGKPHVELIAVRDLAMGMSWFADWLSERESKPAQIVIDGTGLAQNLVDELNRRGIKKQILIKPKAADVINACSAFFNAIKEQSVTHNNQKVLNESALCSKKRNIGTNGGWAFADNGCTSTAIESAALAYWAAMNTKRNPNRKTRVGF